MALIYLTIPYTPRVRDFFIGLLGTHFDIAINVLLTAIIVATAAVIFIRRRRYYNLSFYLSVTTLLSVYAVMIYLATPVAIEKMHLLEYGFLSYLALRAVNGSGVIASETKQSLCVILIVILVGFSDEAIQRFTPGRFYQTKDVILNMVSGILSLFMLKLLKLKSFL